MSTIVTDGTIIIADKRSTHTLDQVGYEECEIYIDNVIKIHSVPDNIYCENDKVVKMACTGNVSLIQKFSTLLNKFSDKSKVEINDLFITTSHMSVNKENISMSMILLLEDSTEYAIVRWSDNAIENRITTSTKDKGGITVIGSGYNVFSQISPFLTPDITLLDTYLFCAHVDPNSSMECSSFNLDTGELISSITPSEKNIKAAIKRIQSNLNFYRPDLKRKPLDKT